ncbi:DUF2306 domain-containing protein [Sphingomonas sp.]|uniref:DUF2306 domain-containing protein n=1 Tax=Sphingomonas sp. TaxID=28214 RepID=UPI003B3B16E5
MTPADRHRQRGRSTGRTLLRRSATAWFTVATAGQAAFVWMIVAHYGRKTLTGNLLAWNEKPLIKGYVAGDGAGNAMFAVHVLLATFVTAGGLLQLVPPIRKRAPALHRWVGRTFFVVAIVMALSGLWLTWVRKTYLSLISALAVSIDGLLILAFVAVAWRAALRRDFLAHRQWAIRAFMVVNGVWFLRVGLMAWVLITGGGIGMNDSLSGPADIVLQFGAYLIPVAVLEAYFLAQASDARSTKRMTAALVLIMTAITLLGAIGAVAFMWWPYM